MIPKDLIHRHDSKKYMTIEVRHSDTLASLRDEDNTFISSSSTISTRSGLTGLEPMQDFNVAPNTRRVRRQESLTASTIVEKSPVESYEQPQPLPKGKTAMILPLEGRPVLQLEDEDVTIKMLKSMHAQLERELQEKKERSERKKRMKQMLREEKERERRAASKRRGSDETEMYSREQEISDLQLIQKKLKEQKRIEQEIAQQIKRENRNREQRVVRDRHRPIVPANDLLHDSKLLSVDRKNPLHFSEDEAFRQRESSAGNIHRFSSDPKRSPVSRAAPRPPARHLSPDNIEPIVLVSQKLAQMSMSSSKIPTAGSSSDTFVDMTRQEYIPSEEDTALCTFAESSYSSLDPRPFCSAVDSVKLARGEYTVSSEEDDTFVDTFVSDSISLFSERESWEKPAERGAS